MCTIIKYGYVEEDFKAMWSGTSLFWKLWDRLKRDMASLQG